MTCFPAKGDDPSKCVLDPGAPPTQMIYCEDPGDQTASTCHVVRGDAWDLPETVVEELRADDRYIPSRWRNERFRGECWTPDEDARLPLSECDYLDEAQYDSGQEPRTRFVA